MRLLVLFSLAASVLIGCSDAPPPNAAGSEAGTNKTYTAEDANAAQPKRGGQSD